MPKKDGLQTVLQAFSKELNNHNYEVLAQFFISLSLEVEKQKEPTNRELSARLAQIAADLQFVSLDFTVAAKIPHNTQ